MTKLADSPEYQLKESEMIVAKLEPPVYNIMKGITWTEQQWAEIQQYLLIATIYLLGEAPL